MNCKQCNKPIETEIILATTNGFFCCIECAYNYNKIPLEFKNKKIVVIYGEK